MGGAKEARLGIFGGSFDPPHIGHLIVADDAAAALALDRVLFVPTGTHPLKRDQVEAPSEVRLRMIEEATADSPEFQVDDREIRRSGPSYTADTLSELQREYPDAKLFLLVGSDILDELSRWQRVDEIARWATIVAMSRPEADVRADYGLALPVRRIEVTHIGISSTEIRERIRAGRPYRHLLPVGVHRIIEGSRLYRPRASASVE